MFLTYTSWPLNGQPSNMKCQMQTQDESHRYNANDKRDETLVVFVGSSIIVGIFSVSFFSLCVFSKHSWNPIPQKYRDHEMPFFFVRLSSTLVYKPKRRVDTSLLCTIKGKEVSGRTQVCQDFHNKRQTTFLLNRDERKVQPPLFLMTLSSIVDDICTLKDIIFESHTRLSKKNRLWVHTKRV